MHTITTMFNIGDIVEVSDKKSIYTIKIIGEDYTSVWGISTKGYYVDTPIVFEKSICYFKKKKENKRTNKKHLAERKKIVK